MGIIYHIFLLDPELECFDVSLYNIRPATSWTIGNCSSSLNYSEPGVYIAKCCISPGHHILTCDDTDSDDWSLSGLIILGHEFCRDYVGKNARIRLNITGTI